MTVEKAVKAMENGLTVLKFSLDALDEDAIKSIRGKKANYQESIDKINKLNRKIYYFDLLKYEMIGICSMHIIGTVSYTHLTLPTKA